MMIRNNKFFSTPLAFLLGVALLLASSPGVAAYECCGHYSETISGEMYGGVLASSAPEESSKADPGPSPETCACGCTADAGLYDNSPFEIGSPTVPSISIGPENPPDSSHIARIYRPPIA